MGTDRVDTLEFQLLTLSGADEGESYVIRMFGKDVVGRSVCLSTTFTPYFYVLLEKGQTKESVHGAIKKRMVTINPDYESDDEDPSQKKWIPLKHHMKNPIVVSRKKYWGFENGKRYSFVQLTFTTEKAWRRAKRVAEKEGFKIYEGDISPVLRFVHIQKLQTTGWIRTDAATNVSSKQTYCHVEMRCPWKEVHFSDNSSMAPFVQASFDIECYSFDRSFPDPAKPQNCVYQIATTFQRFGDTEPFHKHLVCLGTCNSIEGVVVECVEREADVYAVWSRAVREQHSDIVIGYNIWGFDMKYMWARAGLLSCKKALNFSKVKGHQADLRTSKSSSAAYGDNEYHILTAPGVYQIDLYAWIKKEVKMESGVYSLDHVAGHYLGQQKNDVTPQQIFEKFTQGPAERKEVGEYCVQDTVLPLRLMDKLKTVHQLMALANACYVPIDYLIVRGQSIKVYSQITRITREMEYLCPTFPRDDKSTEAHEKFEGATVLEPKTGAYFTPITVLDFASLYPSCMMAENICYSTVVMDERFSNLPGVEYSTFNIDDTTTITFAQSVESVLPRLLNELKTLRKQYKREMSRCQEAGDTFESSVWDARQLAVKVSMNRSVGLLL